MAKDQPDLPPLSTSDLTLNPPFGDKFSLSLVHVEEPKRLDITLPSRSVKCDLWAYVWGASVILSELMAEMPIAGKAFLEVGAGSALCSITAARLRANVVTTDAVDTALTLAARSAQLNGVGDHMEYSVLNWYHLPELQMGAYDIVVASDVLYMESAVAPVVKILCDTLKPGGVALVADPSRPTAENFEYSALELGLQVIVHELEHVSFGEKGVMRRLVVYELRKPFDAAGGEEDSTPSGGGESACTEFQKCIGEILTRGVEEIRRTRTVEGVAMNGYAYTHDISR